MTPKKIMTGWKRLHSLQETARQLFLSGVLIHNPENIYYFTSVYPHEPSFLIVPPDSEPELVAARSVYAEALKDCLVPVIPGDMDIAETAWQSLLAKKIIRPPAETIMLDFFRKIVQGPLGIEENYLSVYLLKKFHIRSHMDISPVIMEFRSVKDGFEIEHIKKACRIADQSMQEVKKAIRPGISERELSGIFDAKAKSLGADETKCRVRAGENTALPFSRWMDGSLEEGPVLIDYGTRVRGYWSDITRVFYLGEPSEEFLKLYDIVLEARDKALVTMRQGESLYGPEEVIRTIFREKGYEKNMIYAAGHGIGLEVHETPILTLSPSEQELSDEDLRGVDSGRKSLVREEAPDKSDLEKAFGSSSSIFIPVPSGIDEGPVFRRNQVFALEPGIYLDNLGVRIEDMVLVGEKPSLLSSFSTELGDIIIRL